MTALLLLMPGTPMLFQGQEFGASIAVPLFRRSQSRAGRGGRKGPRRIRHAVSEPGVGGGTGAVAVAARRQSTFERCKLHWDEYETTRAGAPLHEDLLRLRRATRAFRAQAEQLLDGAVLDAGGVRAAVHARTPMETSVCSSSTSGATSRAGVDSPNRSSRRRTDYELGHRVVE